MFSVKIDGDKKIVEYDEMTLPQHIAAGREGNPLYRFIDRSAFRTDRSVSNFLISPTRHYFDEDDVLRRLI